MCECVREREREDQWCGQAYLNAGKAYVKFCGYMAAAAVPVCHRLGFAGLQTTDRHISPICPGRVELRSLRRGTRLRAFVAQHIDVGAVPPAESSEEQRAPPTIEVEFLGPEPGPDGAAQVDRASVASGEKLLRTMMLENKLGLYDLYGKIMNCGGGGSCGTCIVEILEGGELLNERTDAEDRHLQKKPENWRLSCQTIMGNKLNSGKVVVQRLPQKRK